MSQAGPEPANEEWSSPPSASFFTGVDEADEAGRLRRYVNALQSKLDYAKWKQGLVLKFNYMPMKRIAEKVSNERANYVRKIAEEEQACAKMLAGKEITVQLDRFRDFSQKLTQRMAEIEASIAEQELKKQMLQQEVAHKRSRLKAVLKENMQMVKANLERAGVASKDDIITLVRSKSTRARLRPTAITFHSKPTSTPNPIPRQALYSVNSLSSVGVRSTIRLFQECLDMLVESIQSMKSSEDIQSGIYLDIMGRRDYSTQGRYTGGVMGGRSKISDTLHQKFGSNHQLRVRNQRNKADFEMQWQTFRELNWKQIMGIVLVKDRGCTRTKRLLKCK